MDDALACRRADPAAIATELVLRRELTKVLAALEDAGVRTLVFKGAALAFTHYPFPAARPRLDADLLVAPDDRGAAIGVLERLGYRHPLRIPGDLTRSQAVYERVDELGVRHQVDLHWKVSKPQVFADLFSWDELAADAVSVPALGPAARTVSPVHALAIACVHRVAHHSGEDRPIWLYDIHLLASGLSASEAARFIDIADRKQIAGVCANGVALARQHFTTTLGDGLIETLERFAAARNNAPSAVYLRRRFRKIDVLRSDLAALPTWRARARLVREHVFPPAWYMREMYGISTPALLPALYAWRVVRGIGGWFRA